MSGEGADGGVRYSGARIAGLGVLAVLVLLPVTLPITGLRELVQHRFAVSEFAAHAFMSINMIGAFLAAPLAGALADRWGRRRGLLVAALALDALCFLALTADFPFAAFMAIRFVEGCAHIGALSLLMGVASGARPEHERSLALGVVGSGLLLGVALGAPIGAQLGERGELLPLQAGAAIVLIAAVLAAALVRETGRAGEARPSFREIAALVRAHPIVALPLTYSFADRFTVGFFTTTFSFLMRNEHDLPRLEVGALIASFMLPFAVLSFPFGLVAQRTSRALLLAGGSLIYGIFVASLGFWPREWFWWAMPLTGITAAVMFMPSMLMTTETTPERIRTMSLGAFNAAGSLGFIVGPLVGGAVSALVSREHGSLAGYQAAFVVAGASQIVLALATWIPLWRFERARSGVQ
ncbi:MAG: MFS transporter [Deltaproteobacteria bacterium]|nr:MFS transporter [Deltaproteobacteria bacterium]